MLIWELEMILSRLEKRRIQLKTELSLIGEGSLSFQNKSGRYFFREYNNYSQKGITKNEKRIYQLARKDYLKKKLIAIEKEISLLHKTKGSIEMTNEAKENAELYMKYKMLDIDRLIYTEEQLGWIKNKSSMNPFKREHLKYVTASGINVRSKSERFIGNLLDEHGFVYRYEPEINVNGRPVYPDFMIMREDGKTVIWEHCGIMDNPSYFNNMMTKLEEYRHRGYKQNNNLICTYEEDLRSKENLEEIIWRFLKI